MQIGRVAEVVARLTGIDYEVDELAHVGFNRHLNAKRTTTTAFP